MNKMLNYVVTVLSVVALGLSTFCMTKMMQIPDPGQKDIQYVLYLGTNDKDTNAPVFQPE
jgi:hypothetical protein